MRQKNSEVDIVWMALILVVSNHFFWQSIKEKRLKPLFYGMYEETAGVKCPN